MKEITIGDKSLMQISKEDILQLAVMCSFRFLELSHFTGI